MSQEKLNFDLVTAAKDGDFGLVKELIEQGAHLHCNGELVLRMAAYYGNFDVVKYCIENSADIHANQDEAFIFAAQYGYLNIVEYLYKNGAYIHNQNGEALHYATIHNKTDVVEFIKSKSNKIEFTGNSYFNICSDLVFSIMKSIRPILLEGAFDGEVNYDKCTVELLDDNNNSAILVKWGDYDCNFFELPITAMAMLADVMISQTKIKEENETV